MHPKIYLFFFELHCKQNNPPNQQNIGKNINQNNPAEQGEQTCFILQFFNQAEIHQEDNKFNSSQTVEEINDSQRKGSELMITIDENNEQKNEQKNLLVESNLQCSMQGSIYMEDPTPPLEICQKKNEKSEYSPQKQISKAELFDIIKQATLSTCFNAFDFTLVTQLKLQSESSSRIQKIGINGASFGRNELNTYCFRDQKRISSQHAQILFQDNQFLLKDKGSKGGTFIKIGRDFVIDQFMQIYIGNIFVLKIVEMQCDRNVGRIKVLYEKRGKNIQFEVQMKQGDKWKVGKQKFINQTSLQKSQYTFFINRTRCNKLLSPQHFELVYDISQNSNQPVFIINDLESKHGTWLRIGDKQKESQMIKLLKNSTFSLSFEAFFKVVEINYTFKQ